MTKATHCEIAGCGEPLSPRSNLSICPLCRSSIGTWRKRRPAEVLERRRRLRKYDSRMAELIALRIVKTVPNIRRRASK